jgi:hypothetical protein
MSPTVAAGFLLPFAALSLAAVGYFIRAAVRGKIHVRGKRCVRSRQPRQFWTTIAMGIFFAGALSIVTGWVGLHGLFPKDVPALTTR